MIYCIIIYIAIGALVAGISEGARSSENEVDRFMDVILNCLLWPIMAIFAVGYFLAQWMFKPANKL